jgi:protein-disulfide isomerase
MGHMTDRRTALHLLGLSTLGGLVTSRAARAQDLPSLLSGLFSEEKTAKLDLSEAGPLGDTVIGKPGAPVTIIEYASLACPLCRAFHGKVFPQVRKAYIDTGKAVFIYREFPIGKAAQSAAVVARCAPAKDYFRLSEKLLANQGKWWGQQAALDPLYKLVQETGLSRAAFDSCLANQPINDGIVWSKQRGRKLGVEGTPTFFINGQKVRGLMSFEEMRGLIESHLASAKPA